jgi:hypothetical protein
MEGLGQGNIVLPPVSAGVGVVHWTLAHGCVVPVYFGNSGKDPFGIPQTPGPIAAPMHPTPPAQNGILVLFSLME